MCGVTVRSVIVVGGGPVGVMGSLLLAQRGFAVTVFEREPAVYNLPRAIIMDAEIQRVFDGAGLLDGLQAITTPVRGAEFVDTHGTQIIGAASRPAEENALGLPDGVMYYQPELEAFLRSAAVDAGVDLRLGMTVESVEDHGTGVSVSVRSSGGDSTSHDAEWLIAADGAASPIRKALGRRVRRSGVRSGVAGPRRRAHQPRCSAPPVRPADLRPETANDLRARSRPLSTLGVPDPAR